ncbi:MAG: phage tail protein [Thermocrinis sp.]|jgi:hypothetical protein|uniref:phage tail-collar fiber domain-containing protein n=1 Tax=Thermocrinis sp. TaxID=2024383 RepID=UPI003C04EED7
MADFRGTILTQRGRNLLAKAQTENALTFTKIKIGDGLWPSNTDPTQLNDLVSPKLNLPIQEIRVVGDGTVRLRFVLTNTGLSQGFFMREIGIYAQDPDIGEILYAVAYAGDRADFIPADGITKVENVVDIYTVIANAQNVTAVISDTVVLATKQDIDTVKPEASSTAPNLTYPGKLWIDANDFLKYFNGSDWRDLKVSFADTVDGFHASLVPAPNVIPITNTQSVIPQDFLPLFTPLSIPYSQLYIQSSAPSFPYLYDSWYNIETNELFYWNGSAWIKVDWTKWIQNDIWFRLEKLRVNNGSLEISNNRTNWYRVFPAIGRIVEVIADDTNPADNFKIAYLTVGQTLLVRGRNLARASAVSPSLWVGNYYHTYVGGLWFGIFPSNITISDGYGQWVAGHSHNVSAYYTSSRTFVPITEQANEAHNWALFSIQILNNRMTTTSVGHGETGLCLTANIGSGSFPSNGYFLGSFCYEGTRIVVDYLAITRQG